MAIIKINSDLLTIANIKATLEARHDACTDFGGTCSIWTKGDVTRVYLNDKKRSAICYITLVEGGAQVTSVGTFTWSKMAADLLATDSPVEPVAAVKAAVATASKAKAWDNLYNEGVRDGGYNPYRQPTLEGYGVSTMGRVNPVLTDEQIAGF